MDVARVGRCDPEVAALAAAARASEQRLLADDAASGPYAITPPVVDGAADPFA